MRVKPDNELGQRQKTFRLVFGSLLLNLPAGQEEVPSQHVLRQWIHRDNLAGVDGEALIFGDALQLPIPLA